LLSVMLMVVSIPLSTSANETMNIYSMEQIKSIHSKYRKQAHMLEFLFSTDNNLGYWKMANNIKNNKAAYWMIEKASMMLGEYLETEGCVEVLSNLMLMQSGNLAQQIETQSKFDDMYDGKDYVLDIIDIAESFVGGSGVLENISPIIEAGSDGIDVVVDSIEQAKYYKVIFQDYTQSQNFLKAVSKYAEDKELKEAAELLLTVNDTLLEKRLEYLGNTLEGIEKYEVEFFRDNLLFEVLKNTDTYLEDDTTKWFVDCGEKIQQTLGALNAGGKFVFDMMMMIGNVGFGTNNTFNRYQEMRILAQIADSLSKANKEISVPLDYEEGILEKIQLKCDYYRSLIVTHTRGEYLIHQLLMADAGLLSQFKSLFDMFKETEDTVDGWYVKQTNVLNEYSEILEQMFIVTEEKIVNEEQENSDEKYVLLSTTDYDRDGRKISLQEFEYDERGNAVKSKLEYYGIDEIVWEYEYEYDDKMNRTERRYFEDGMLQNEYKYNQEGFLIEGKTYNVEGNVEWWSKSEFNQQGQIIKNIQYYQNGEIYDVMEFKYDESGRLIETISQYDGLTLYEYDNQGNKSRTIYDNEGMRYVNEYQYDSLGNELKVIMYENGTKIGWAENEYGYIKLSKANTSTNILQTSKQDTAADQLARKNYYNKDGELIYYEIYAYYDNGLLCSTTLHSVQHSLEDYVTNQYTLLYLYDENGKLRDTVLDALTISEWYNESTGEIILDMLYDSAGNSTAVCIYPLKESIEQAGVGVDASRTEEIYGKVSMIPAETEKTWAAVYLDNVFEGEEPTDMTSCRLICVDNNIIPELWIDYGYGYAGAEIYTQNGNGTDKIGLNHGTADWREKENLLLVSEGHMGNFYDKIYEIRDGKFVMLGEGGSFMSADENNEVVLDYYWNDVEVTGTEYEQYINQSFDKANSADINQNIYTYKQCKLLLQAITN